MNPIFNNALVALIAALVPLAAIGWGGVDGWSSQETAILSSLRLSQLEPAPPDPSNRYEGVPAAEALGKRFFFDKRFSSNGEVSCASCHDPEQQFQDGRPVGRGVGTGARRTMPVAGLGHSPFLFWDGRKDSAWSQALGPLEDAAEHGGNRLAYAHAVQANYRRDYEAVFGPLPNLASLPRDAGPLGDDRQRAAWKAMDERSREAVSRVFANMGKAIAAYEKTLQHSESRLDRYLEAVTRRDAAAYGTLNAQEKNGLRIFIGKGQCVTCHNGPLLSDQHFHNTGVPQRNPAKPDLGRRQAITKVIADEFNCLGRFSDAKQDDCGELRFIAQDDHAMEAAFKTPSLRNVAQRAPYMHAGQKATLLEVVEHYRNAPAPAAGHSELKPVAMTDGEVRDLVAFLGTLTGAVVERRK
ncbi:cytochrome-c peroxidase [Noviherbaspirillum denitrificans]|uniref:Cytochrome-c peroxidase n=1 Tax=Noviherbaspirillum denitrificans TaxID=1968433 RepID=A0A254TD63_9BURK|nr:cytochrome c peroxidase [Noviherbaspirillum denitrificans]OWW19252.1 cytochrome-c peroxidase [Noviherbaspirillum denitrificans]